MKPPPVPLPVQVGQVWADNDKRMAGRTLRVEAVIVSNLTGAYARCVVLTPADASTDRAVGRRVGIRLTRFRPTSTGYRLVRNADGSDV